MKLPLTPSTAALCLLLTASCGDPDQNGGATSASLSVGPGPSYQVDTSTPEGAMTGAVRALAAGQISGFMRAVAPPRSLEEMEQQWDEKRKDGMSEEEAAEFERFMAMLTTEGAEDMLFAMAKPKLAEAKQQMQMLSAMAPMLAAGVIEEAGAPDDALAAVQSFSTKMASIDIGSEENAKKAIAIVCTAARDLDLAKAKDLEELEFDGVLTKFDVIYGAALEVLDVYGLGLGKSFESIEVTSLTETGDKAQMEMRMSLFGLEMDPVQFDMERTGDRWALPYSSTESDVNAPGAKLAR